MAERTDDLSRSVDERLQEMDVDVDDLDAPDREGATSSVDADHSDLDGSLSAPDEGLSDPDQNLSDLEADLDVGGPTVDTDGATTEAETSRFGRLTGGTERVFSPVAFVLQFVVALAGVFVVGDVIPLVPLAGFVGLLLTTLLAGTLSSKPRYLETAAAGGASGALALFLGSVALSVVTGGLLPAVGGALGALVALVGHYAGRDLRDGLTRDL